MLFGEYSLICGSMGLVVPFKSVSASWDWIKLNENNADSRKSNAHLFRFLEFLNQKPTFQKVLQLEQFQQDLEKGLYLKSSITQGYGIGSSGALVAALFKRYSQNENSHTIIELRAIFSEMESYFHGSSSGIDPISCYLGETVLIDENGDISCIENPIPGDESSIKAYLIDTKMPRETAHLMRYFDEQLHQYRFFKKMQDQLIPAVNSAIQQFSNDETDAFFQSLKTISDFELTYLEPMVPLVLREFWQAGLSTENYFMKLCGAGGGGYILVFAREDSALDEIGNHFEMINLSE